MNAVKFAVLGLVGVIGLLISTFGPFKIPYAETLAKTYYRHAIAGLLIVALLLGGLIAIAVHTLNPNQFKSQIVRYVQERTQRELILDQGIHVVALGAVAVSALFVFRDPGIARGATSHDDGQAHPEGQPPPARAGQPPSPRRAGLSSGSLYILNWR